MLRWSVLGLAVLVNLPGLYGALVTQSTAVDEVLVHLLVTVPVVALLLYFLRTASTTDGTPPARRDRPGPR